MRYFVEICDGFSFTGIYKSDILKEEIPMNFQKI